MDLITLSDLPALQGTDPKPRTTITIGRLDDNLRDPRYGKFAITQRQVDSWKRNLAGVMGGQVSIDFDHSSDRGNGTRAAAWITSIDQQGKLITADVEFSKRGARAVRNGDYKYTSPTFVENYTDEHGVKHGPALIGAALTNRPVLREGMPTLSLSKDEFADMQLATVSPATRKRTATLKGKKNGKKKPEFPMPDAEHARLALQFVTRSLKAGNITPADAATIRARANAMLGKKTAAARDSRDRMDLSELAVLLDLDPNADLATVLTGVVTLQKPASPPSPSRTPNGPASSRPTPSGRTAGNPPASAKASKKAKKLAKRQAKQATMSLSSLDDEKFAQLLLDANAGASAATQLAEDRFANAYAKALSEGRVAPSQEDTLRELHKMNPELALKTLASFVPIVPVTPSGSGEGPVTEAPMGMDLDRYQLHTEAKALAAEMVRKDPSVDEGEAYALAAIQIEERKFTMDNGGF